MMNVPSTSSLESSGAASPATDRTARSSVRSGSAACVVGRFAPTPSGRMHLGNVFSCLMAWLAVRSANGRLVLRIEDLDLRARRPSATATLIGDLAWLGLLWDEGPYLQSERADRYEAALSALALAGLTYPCFCTRAELHATTAPHASDGTYVYPGTCRHLSAADVAARRALRPPAVRVAVPSADDPGATISFTDAVYGPQRETLPVSCGDFIVQRSDGIVAYQLAVVVDDAEMGVTQVVRGHDLLGSAARQSWLARALGHTPPAYAHVPLLTAADGRRLSKRDHDLDLGVLREQGYTAPDLIGALAHAVGLAAPRERVSAAQLITRFSWDCVRAHRDDIVVGSDFLP